MQAATKNKIIGSSLFVIVIAGFFGLKWIFDYNNIDHIKYNGRTYYKSKTAVINAKERDYIRTDYADTGKKEKGMEVYAIKDNPNNLTNTVLYLKTKEGSFVVYELSGGP